MWACCAVFCRVNDLALFELFGDWSLPSIRVVSARDYNTEPSGTYLFSPPVVSANGIPRKTEFPCESAKPLTVAAWRFAVASTICLAGFEGRGVPPTTATSPKRMASERVCKPHVRAVGILIMQRQGVGLVRKDRVWPQAVDHVRAVIWLYVYSPPGRRIHCVVALLAANWQAADEFADECRRYARQ